MIFTIKKHLYAIGTKVKYYNYLKQSQEIGKVKEIVYNFKNKTFIYVILSEYKKILNIEEKNIVTRLA